MDDSCLICCSEQVFFSARYSCNHRICCLCFSRLFILQENFNCQICKEQKDIFLEKKSAKSAIKPCKLPILTNKNFNKKIFYDSNIESQKKIDQFFEKIVKKKCSICIFEFDNTSKLTDHYKNEHKIMTCKSCNLYKKVFPFEFSLFKNIDIQKHRKGESGFKYQTCVIDMTKNKFKIKLVEKEAYQFIGHPFCTFCKFYFFDEKNLKDHCSKSHSLCEICANAGSKNRFFCGYESLNKHIDEDHFVCTICKEGFYHKSELSQHSKKKHNIRLLLSEIIYKSPKSKQLCLNPFYLSIETESKNINKEIEELNLGKKMSEIKKEIEKSKLKENKIEKRRTPIINAPTKVANILLRNIEKDLEINEMLCLLKEIAGPKETLRYVDLYKNYLNGMTDEIYKKFQKSVLFPSFTKSESTNKKKYVLKTGFGGLNLTYRKR